MADMKHEIWIKSEKEDIYKAFATVEGLKSWWTTDIEHNNEEKTLKFGFYDSKYWMKFKILDTVENKKVKWKCVETDDGSSDWIGTEIEIEVDEIDGNLRVSLVHSNWNEDSRIFAMCNSTWGNLMFSLKDYVEEGEGQPMS